jgi:hypothetical protein
MAARTHAHGDRHSAVHEPGSGNDLHRGRSFEELVAHGRESGEDRATRFSNDVGSHQSSLGLFVTLDEYRGRHGRSLRLRGLEPGVNDRALDRALVIHGADYVSEAFGAKHGRLGRIWLLGLMARRRAEGDRADPRRLAGNVHIRPPGS